MSRALLRALTRALNFDEALSTSENETRAREALVALDAYKALPHLDDVEKVIVEGESCAWSSFVDTNLDAGMDAGAIAEIEAALVRCGRYRGFHDADVWLASKADDLAIEDVVMYAPIERVRDFVADFWDRGEPSEAHDADVRTYALQVIGDGLRDGSITRDIALHLFDDMTLVPVHAPIPEPVIGRREQIERAPLDALDLLAIANRLRVDGHEHAANVIMRAAVSS